MKGSQKNIRLLIAGGGTGGHLFPGVAVAKEISRRYGGDNVLFITGRRKMESEIIGQSGFHHRSISVEGLKGKGWLERINVLMKLPFSFLHALFIIRGFNPDAVLGLGAYSAGPVCLAAKVLGIPLAIHEQNSYPGLTNRMLCKWVDQVFISFEVSREHFRGGSLLLTGNPIRPELLLEEKPTGGNEFTVLVVGGSQGARAINRAFVEAMEILKDRGKVPHAIHQTGELDYKDVWDAYRSKGIEGNLSPFIQDMAGAYHKADIVIGRAGATTVSELAALGKPSILIPYPYAANRHQETNALMLVDAGGAKMILQEDLSGRLLAEALIEFIDDRKVLDGMSMKAKALGRPDAAENIVDQLVEMVQ